jgi:hypothetical protein
MRSQDHLKLKCPRQRKFRRAASNGYAIRTALIGHWQCPSNITDSYSRYRLERAARHQASDAGIVHKKVDASVIANQCIGRFRDPLRTGNVVHDASTPWPISRSLASAAEIG